MKTILIAIAACASLTTGTAFAAPAVDTTANAAADAAKSAPAQADGKRYCLSDTPTGSRLPRKVCNTRAQWSALGVDADKLGK